MHRGYIKYWRKIEEWSWYKDSNTKSLFLHLVANANHKDTIFRGCRVPRGSLVCGRFSLSEQTGISIQSIRTAIFNLKSTNDITIKSTNKFSVIRIVNYENYQSKSTSKSTSKLTNNQPTTNQQLTTSKEVKNVRMIRSTVLKESLPKNEDPSPEYLEFHKLTKQLAKGKSLC